MLDFLIIVEPRNHDDPVKYGLTDQEAQVFKEILQKHSLTNRTCRFIPAAEPFPESCDTDAKKKKHVTLYTEKVQEAIARTPHRLLIVLGKYARHSLLPKVKSNKAAGFFVRQSTISSSPVFVSYALSMVLRNTDYLAEFVTAMFLVKRFAFCEYDFKLYDQKIQERFNPVWCTDLQFLIDNPPSWIGLDTETTGLDVYLSTTKCLTVQIAYTRKDVVVVPLDIDYYPELKTETRKKLINQLRVLLNDPKVNIVCHNVGYDARILKKTGIGIEAPKKLFDSMQLAHMYDRSLSSVSLDEATRRLIPSLAGYNDELNRLINKSDMASTPHNLMLAYAGGDPIAALNVALFVLDELKKNDPQQLIVYLLVCHPTIDMFWRVLSENGVRLDVPYLQSLTEKFTKKLDDLYSKIMPKIPKYIKQKHLISGNSTDEKLGLKLSRNDFLADILFTPEGLGLEPLEFTETGSPSTDKKHLTYFKDVPLVQDLIDYSVVDKLLNTYIGQMGEYQLVGTGKYEGQDKKVEMVQDSCEEGYRIEKVLREPSALWKYSDASGYLHPNYFLTTDTLRSRSSSPNAQNFPERGKDAKILKKAFIPHHDPDEETIIIAADYSQAELRVACWESLDPVMLDAYNASGDLHIRTGCLVSRISEDDYWKMSSEDQGKIRFSAKAVNFGLCYGAWWTTFQRVAKIDYGVEYTDAEAKKIREDYFNLYKGLPVWQERRKEEVRKNGYVRSLHGVRYELPQINSTDKKLRQGAERAAINYPVQGFACHIALIAFNLLTEDLRKAQIDDKVRYSMYVHDAGKFSLTRSKVEEFGSALRYYMENVAVRYIKDKFNLTSPIPFGCDIEFGLDMASLQKEKFYDGSGEYKFVEKRPYWATY